MKRLLLVAGLLLTCIFLKAQTYPHYKIDLIGYINPNTVDSSNDNRHYSGCWGWYQQNKNKEYAISGTSNGAYFIDITAPATPSVCDFVPGKTGCIWRELKTYQHYCYIISDDPSPNQFQIVDMQYLPDSVHLVYSGRNLFERGHTIWIDNDKMYIGSTTYTSGYSPMTVFSLATPTAPVLLRRLEQDVSGNVAGLVHDMYVRNDTVYASCGNQGFQIFKFNSVVDSFKQLGSYTGYPFAGYNHSSSLTKNGKYMVFCDEVPTGCPVHFIDVQNLNNIQSLNMAKPFPGTTPHNPYILGNDFAVVSCYQDGLILFNISELPIIGIAGYFDTHPQGGDNTGSYGSDDYRGNWGAYPYLPSGRIIAQDMQNGVFILDATAAFFNPLGVKTNTATETNFIFYPNPAFDKLAVSYNSNSACTLQIKDMLGRQVYENHFDGAINVFVDVRPFASGNYIMSLTDKNGIQNKRLIINH